MQMDECHMKKWMFTARLCFSVLLLVVSELAAAACSGYIGKVTLNEYNYIDNFVEIKKTDSTVDLTGWQVQVYTAQKTTSKALPATGTNSCYGGVYQVSQFASNEIGPNADMVLLDKAGDVVDFARVRTSLPVTTAFYTPIPSCPFIPASGSTDVLVESDNKGVDRLADGDGPWRNTPGSGNNSFQSRCGPNVVGGSADLSVSKMVNPSTVVKGNSVVFTVGIINNGNDPATGVLVDDLLPSGLSYSSYTATAGSYAPATGVWTVGNLAVNATATLTITANTTLVGTLVNTARVASSQFDPLPGNNAASVSVVVTSPGASLDAVEVTANAGTSIKTKRAGVGFNLDILALDTNGNIATSYNKTVTIELVNADTGSSCATMTALQAAGSYTFVSADKGRKTFAFNYPHAARNVRVRMTDNSTPTNIKSCSTDSFSVRPAQLTLSSNPALNPAVDRLAAGADFVLTANPGVTQGYSGTPVLDLSKVLDHNGASVIGALTWTNPPSGGFPQAAAASVSNTFQYQDVGTITFNTDAVVDSTFTIVDQVGGDCVSASTSATLDAQNKYGCNIGSAAFGPLGRFYPDHFSVDVGLSPHCAAGGFTYMDDDALGVTLLVKAQSKSNVTTSRYVTPSSTYVPVAPLVVTLLNGSSATDLLARLSQPVVPVRAWTVGAYAATDTYRFDARNLATPVVDGPYDSLKFRVTITDATDAVKISTLNGAALSPSVSTVDSATTVVRFGRLWLANAYGTEKNVLNMRYEAQHWNGSAFVTNGLDNCTSFVAATIALGNLQGTLAAPAVVVNAINNGVGSITLTPSSGAGSADLAVNLGGTLNMCPTWTPSSAPAGASPDRSYLRGKWCGNAYDHDPAARATFGISGGSAKKGMIYLRENY